MENKTSSFNETQQIIYGLTLSKKSKIKFVENIDLIIFKFFQKNFPFVLELIEKYDLDSKKRDRDSSYMRIFLSNYLLDNNISISLISFLLKRDHSTIVFYKKQWELWKDDKYFNKVIEPLKMKLNRE